MNASPCISLVNGIPADVIPVLDRGFTYGHGVFETIRVWRLRPNLLSYHLERLRSGLQRLQIPASVNSVERQFQQLLALAAERQWRDGVVKIIVTAGAGGRGYGLSDKTPANIIVQWHLLPPVSEQAFREGIRVKLCKYRLPENPVLAGIKHLNRLDQVMAATELEDGFQEGIVRDQKDHIIECVSSNVFMRVGNQLLTPMLNKCGVSGVMRRLIIEQFCPSLGLPCIERDITLGELTNASEMFICNSLRGIHPVIEIAPLVTLNIGDWTRQLQQALAEELPCYKN